MLLHRVLACLLLLISVVHGIGGGRTGRRASQGDRREKLQNRAFENLSHCLAFRRRSADECVLALIST
jgi:hypothetical protein